MVERIETLIRTAIDASLTTRRLIDVSHGWTSADVDQPEGPVEEICVDALISEFVSAEKAAMGPAVNWVLNLTPVAPIRGKAEPLQMMFRQFVRNAVEAFPEERERSPSRPRWPRATGW